MNGKKNLGLGYNALAKAVYLACLGMAGQQALAQEPVEEVTVTGSRLIQSGVNTPTPVTAVSAADLQTMAPTTLIESLSQLPVFNNNLTSQQAVGGSVASGGSNLNLRGLEARRTLVLMDGHRLGPSNKFGTVDVSVIPEMLVSSVEAVTGGASAAYGADAVAGVVNFRLDRNFTGTKYQFQAGQTTESDGESYKAGVAYGSDIGERGHIIVSGEYWDKEGIRSLESLQARSDYLNLKAQVTNPDPANGPDFLARPFVSPTNFTAGGLLLAPEERNAAGVVTRPLSAVDHIEFLPDGSGQYRPLPFSGVGVLSGGCNCQARPTLEYGIDSDYEVDTPADRGVAFVHYDHELSDRNSFYLETLLANSSQANVWQSAALLGPWGARIFADNPFLPAPLRLQLQAEGRQFAGFGIFTPNLEGNPFDTAELIAKNRYGQFVTGFAHDMSEDFLAGNWVLDGYAQYAQNRQETVVPGGMRTDLLPIAMDVVTGPTGQPVCRVTLFIAGPFDDCVPINLIGGTASVTPEAAAYVLDNGKIARGRTTENDAEVTLRGDLTEGGDVLGPITAAFGVSWRQQSLNVRTIDPCDEFPCTASGVRLSDLGLMSPDLRGVLPDSLRSAPAIRTASRSSARACRLRRRRELEHRAVLEPACRRGRVHGARGVLRVRHTAARGRQIEPQRGVPLGRLQRQRKHGRVEDRYLLPGRPRFRLRATRSQDVRARRCKSASVTARRRRRARSPERQRADQHGIVLGRQSECRSRDGGDHGVRLRLEPLDKFSITIDHYDVDLDGAIGQLPAQTIVNTCSASGGTSPLCQFVIRDASNQIVRVESLYINLSNMRIQGVDLELNYSGIEVGGGTLSWRLLGSRLDENSILTPGSPRIERAGDVGAEGLPDTKVTTSFRYTHGPVALFLQERYIGGGVSDRDLIESPVRIPGLPPGTATIDNNTVDSVLYTDLTFNYSGGRAGGTPWEAFFTVNNLLDEAPPDMYSVVGRAGVGGPNTLLYDTIGRRFVAGVRVNF
jgi:outer membrane receptor protein involved in Fe transport